MSIRKTAYDVLSSGRYGYALDAGGKDGMLRWLLIVTMGVPVAVYRYSFRCAGLALLPMACALAGAAIDERMHLGYSNWVSACRAAGPELSSILTFTLELLPSAVIGALLGGLAVQGLGVLLRYRGCAARVSLAAHAGCTLGMAGGMLLCTLVTPSPALLIAEAMLAACAAAMLTWNMARKAPAASVAPPAHMLTSAQ